MTLIVHYRSLLGALLEHGWINHEGTELAIADFKAADDRAWPILMQILEAQKIERSEGR